MHARLIRILIVLAGVMGADGVMLAAASAHQPDAARLASAGLGPALVPDNIVLPGIEGSVLRLKPRVIRDVAAYARTEWSSTAAAFIGMLGSERKPRPRDAVTIRL